MKFSNAPIIFMNIDKICLLILALISSLCYPLLKVEGDIPKILTVDTCCQFSGMGKKMHMY